MNSYQVVGLAGCIAAVVLVPTDDLQAFPIAVPGTEGLKVLIASTDAVVATYQGNSASFSNDLYLVTDDGDPLTDVFIFNNHTSPVGSTKDLGSFAVGTELLFRLHVNNTGNDFFTGDATRNPDNNFHARVQEEWQPDETLVSFEDLFNGPFDYNDLSFSFSNTVTTPPPVPEPISMMVLMGGLGLAGWRRSVSR
jgi:hypothetical protein